MEEAFAGFAVGNEGGILFWATDEDDENLSNYDVYLSWSRKSPDVMSIDRDGYVVMARMNDQQTLVAAGFDRKRVDRVLEWIYNLFGQAHDWHTLVRAYSSMSIFNISQTELFQEPNWTDAFFRYERTLGRSAAKNQVVAASPVPASWWDWMQSSLSRAPDRKYSSLNLLIEDFKEKLLNRNVAVEVIDRIAKDVSAHFAKTQCDLTQRNLGQVLETLLHKILKPVRSKDLCLDVQNSKACNQVYSIVVMGVNGVGKSTTLAKVAYFLKSRLECSVVIAACDTFRSGAVEQLKLHASALNIELFQKGYGSEPAAVAKAAMKHAKANSIDVVLIDTAGRMQDNAPLMQALGKLVKECQPDLLLFVAEALVGNDGLDQLRKFDAALVRATGSRHIDGIILTKLDAVDDKIGATVTMASESQKPISFVGVGQRYEDLRVLEARQVVAALLA